VVEPPATQRLALGLDTVDARVAAAVATLGAV